MLPAVILAAVYLIWSPPSADLAAQTFRTELFEAHGFEVFSNAWYGGFHLPGYSLLFPPLASLIGVRLLGALSAVAATALFAALVRPHYGDRARPAIWLFGIASATNLFTGRLTFALGVALALGALLALDRRHPVWAGALAVLTACGSPVAGLFLAFAGGVLVVTGRRRDGLVVGLAALIATLLIGLAFPTGGVEPFAGNTFTLITAATLILVALLPATESRLRTGAGLYLLLCLALFAIDTPVGGNATRLGALLAAPLFALGAWGRRPAWLVGLALLPLIYWQWVAPVRDLSDAVGEPSVEAAYYDPLLAELEARAPDEPFRVQVPPTRNRWEANYVAERYPLARGWLRQAESDDFDLFQDGNLDRGQLSRLARRARRRLRRAFPGRRARLPVRGRDRPRPRRAAVPRRGLVERGLGALRGDRPGADRPGAGADRADRDRLQRGREPVRRVPGRRAVLALLQSRRGRCLRVRAGRVDGGATP